MTEKNYITQTPVHMNGHREEQFKEYLTAEQYQAICQWWKDMRNLCKKKDKIANSLFQQQYCSDCYYHNEYEKNDYCVECMDIYEQREEIQRQLGLVESDMVSHQQNYENYVSSIGLELLDREQEERLFYLLNHGDDMVP